MGGMQGKHLKKFLYNSFFFQLRKCEKGHNPSTWDDKKKTQKK